MPVMNWGRRNRPSSAALCPRNYTSLQGLPYRKGHFPIIPQSVRPLLCTLMEQMDWRLAPSAPHISLSPSLYYSVFVYFLCVSHSAYSSPFTSLSHVFYQSCFQHCGLAVYKSHVLSLRRPPLRQPVLWFSLELISCRVIVCMSVPLSVAHNSDTASFPASPNFFILFSCKRMELSRCVTDFSFSGQAHCFPWPPHLKSVETGLFFMSINGLFSCIHEGMLAFWRDLRGYCTILSQGP